ncbi:MAG: hypothetical protein DPW14_10145 [Planctomycetes bacterium]|nr:hypothetical protein [Planctomycetota bacterium]
MAYTRVLLTLPAVPEFVGREAQLAQLAQSLAAPDQSPIVLVTGEAGVGKSRLVAHAFKDRAEFRILTVTAPRPVSVPGSLVMEMLLALLDEDESIQDPVEKLRVQLSELASRHGETARGKDLKAGLPYLLRSAGYDAADTLERSLTKYGYFGELVAALRGLLGCLTLDARGGGQRLLLVMDDLDRADSSSGQLIGRALQGLAEAESPVIVATCANSAEALSRVRSLGREPAVVHVPAFTAEEQSVFVSRILKGTVLPRRLNETLWRRSNGNALVLEQQIRLLVTQHIIISSAENTWTVAEGVESAGSTKSTAPMIADNLRGLPGPTLQAIVAASAIGLRAPQPMLVAMIRELGGDIEDLPRHAVRLIKQGFLKPLQRAEGDWVFRHPVFRDACEMVMPAADQRQFHRAAINALAPFTAALPQRMACLQMHHALECHAYTEALSWAAAAARDVIKRGLFLGVVELADRILPVLAQIKDSPETVAHKAALLLALTRAHIKLGNYGRAADVIGRLPDRSQLDAETLRLALCETADVYVVSGRHPEIVAELEVALSLTPRGTLDYAELAFSFGVIVRRRGETERARDLFFVSREIFLAQGLHGRALDCLHQAANVYRQENRLDQAEMLLDEAYELTGKTANRFDLAGTLLALGSVKAHRGRPLEGEAAFKKAYDLLVAIGDIGRAEMARLNLGSVYYWQGRIEEAVQTYENILSNARRRDEAAATLYCLLNLGLIALYGGRHEQAVARLSEARSECINAGTTAALPVIETGLARAYVALGRMADARDLVATARQTSVAQGQIDFEAMNLALEGELLAHDGKLVDACRRFEESLAKFDELTALGMTSEEMAKGDLVLRFVPFLMKHGPWLAAQGAMTSDPIARCRALLEEAAREYSQMIQSGNIVRQRELDQTQALLSELTRSR